MNPFSNVTRLRHPSGQALIASKTFARAAALFSLTALTVVATTVLSFTAPASAAFAGDTPIKEDALVYFIWPKDGAVIKSGKFWVRFGLRNAGIAPAGIDRENTGHHHLLINTDLPPLDEEIPADRQHVHFGKGQSEARVELPSGTHTLQLLFADHNHVPHNPVIQSKKITVTVP